MSLSKLAMPLLVCAIPVVGCGSSEPANPDIALGRMIFTEEADPACSKCHALKDAGADATIGPNLDDLQPDSTRVSVAVRYGVGIMPTQVGILSQEEIAAVSKYVAVAAGSQE